MVDKPGTRGQRRLVPPDDKLGICHRSWTFHAIQPMPNPDSAAKQFTRRSYKVLKYSSRSSISRGPNFSLNAGIVPLPFAITCRTASSERPEPFRRTPCKDGPTFVSPGSLAGPAMEQTLLQRCYPPEQLFHRKLLALVSFQRNYLRRPGQPPEWRSMLRYPQEPSPAS